MKIVHKLSVPTDMYEAQSERILETGQLEIGKELAKELCTVEIVKKGSYTEIILTAEKDSDELLKYKNTVNAHWDLQLNSEDTLTVGKLIKSHKFWREKAKEYSDNLLTIVEKRVLAEIESRNKRSGVISLAKLSRMTIQELTELIKGGEV